MNKTYITYCLLLALLVTILFNIFMPKSAYISDLHVKVGQIADKDIIAPFDFPLLKTAKQLKKEQNEVTATLKPVYIISDETEFNTIKTINDCFFDILSSKAKTDTTQIRRIFGAKRINMSENSLITLSNPSNSKQVYDLLLKSLGNAYQVGIYNGVGSDSLTVVMDGNRETINKTTLINKNDMISDILSQIQRVSIKQIMADILPQIIRPNVIIDKQLNELQIKKAKESIPISSGMIEKNEILIRSNTRITEDDVIEITSLAKAMQQKEFRLNKWQSLTVNISFFLYFFVLGMILFVFYKTNYRYLLHKRNNFIMLISGLALNALLAILNNQILGLQTLLIPYSLTIISAAILIDIPFALLYNFLSLASISPFVNWETFSPLILALATTIVLLLMNRLKDKHQFFSIWLYLICATTGLTAIFALYKADSIAVIVVNLGYAFVSATLSVLLMILLVPFAEKKWNLSTNRLLLELLDFNHPLLKKLATEAVGTYYHSLIVGNLAERAAETIGANPLLARVGSYYHDIGKIVSPEFFTENNPSSQDIHEKLSPAESAEGIKNHVKEGINLAQKYKFPSTVIDIILQHHGTSYIRYFLDKAEKCNTPIDLDQFRYNGPKPNSKEAVLVMIADIVESITKSWDEVTTDDIKKILNDTVLRLIKEGQFDESRITMRDLVKVKESMIPVLESIYRKRQQYPESEDNSEI